MGPDWEIVAGYEAGATQESTHEPNEVPVARAKVRDSVIQGPTETKSWVRTGKSWRGMRLGQRSSPHEPIDVPVAGGGVIRLQFTRDIGLYGPRDRGSSDLSVGGKIQSSARTFCLF